MMNICTAAKTNPLDCSCICTLQSGHAGKHNCQCGQNWSSEELLMKATSDLKEVLPIFRKYFESISEFRHMCKTDQDQLISDIQNDSRTIADALQNIAYCDRK